MTRKRAKAFGKNNSKIILLSLLALVLIAFGLNYLYNQRSKNEPSPTLNPYPVDVENDGVYTNYQHGFRFKYPPSVFKVGTPGGMVFYERKDQLSGGEADWIGRGIMLSVQTLPTTDPYFRVFEEEVLLKLNQPRYTSTYLTSLPIEKRPNENRIKIGEYPDGHLVNSYSSEWAGVEPFFGYTASWKKGDLLIKIDVLDNQKTKSRQLKIITAIVDSMEFFDPSNPPNIQN